MCNYDEFKNQLMQDKDFIEYLRAAFLKAFDKAISVKVHIETERKRCPVCNSGMYLRASKKTGGYFWGCSNYPKCKGLEQATDAEVADYAEKNVDQFAILKEQSELYRKEYEEAAVKGYDTKPEKKKKETVKKSVKVDDGRTSESVVQDILEEAKVGS